MPCNCSACIDPTCSDCGEYRNECECENNDPSSCRSPKIPAVSSKKRHVGIEVEFFCDHHYDELVEIINRKGLGQLCWLKDDGSLDHEELIGHELNILCTEKNYRQVLSKFNDLFREIEAEVNGTCGLHVHLDARNRSQKQMFSNLVACQDILFKMQPPSRRRNTYCRPTKSRNFDEAIREYERTAINPQAYRRHKTIEVRLHSGTTNLNKISNWIALLIKITSKRTIIKNPIATLQGLNKIVRLSSSMRRYIAARVEAFEEAA